MTGLFDMKVIMGDFFFPLQKMALQFWENSSLHILNFFCNYHENDVGC